MSQHYPPPYDPHTAKHFYQASGFKRLNPTWAKLEIVLGLGAAVLGLVLLRDKAVHDVVSGALIVLGLYLAGAGHRSHLYQSQNRQTAYLAQIIQASRE